MKSRLLWLIAAMIAVQGCSTMNHQTHENCTVTKKDDILNVNDKSSNHERRVSTTCGVFVVEDSLAGGYHSYDTWSQIEEGRTYNIETGGYRAPNMFPTVLKATLVK